MLLFLVLCVIFLVLFALQFESYSTEHRKKIFIGYSNSRTGAEWNGETMRFGGTGQSGSALTVVCAAEYLASAGHDVTFYGTTVKKGTYLGVKYTNEFEDVKYDTAIANEIFIGDVPSDIQADKLLVNFALVERGLPTDFTNQFKNIKEFINVYPSRWTLDSNKERYGDGVVIYNPLMMDMLEDIEIDKDRPFKFAWIANFERGGAIAEKVANKVGAEFVKMDYYTIDDTADKKDVIKNLKESSYFVYPLVLPDGLVHKDTFACCVAEALAMGVIVITWRAGCFPEVYDGSGIVFAKPPAGTDVNLLTNWEYSSDNLLLTDEAVDNLCSEVIRLEKDPELKRRLRLQGSEFARKKFDCAHEWERII
jgi:glycosyltransferase involved in cell wall biosynthesis